MRCRGLLLVAVLPRAVGLPSEVSSEFSLSEGYVAFKFPYEQTGSDGFSWLERDYYGDYYNYYDIFEYYYGRDYFDYYYGQLSRAISRRQVELIAGGQTMYGFECHGNAQLDALSIDTASVDTRKLQISVAYYYATYLNTAAGWWSGDYYFFEDHGDDGTGEGKYAVDVWLKSVTTADVSDSLGKLSATGQWRAPSILLKVQPIGHGGKLHAQGTQLETGLALEYECFGTGQTLVQVTLTAQSADSPREDICVNWIKQCSMALPFIGIEDDDLEDAVVDNVVLADAPLFKQPVADMYSFFYVRLMHAGSVRMRVPDIYTGNEQIGDVDVRFEDEENTFMDLSRMRTRITVGYTCFKEGVFPVHMMLQRDWSSYTEILAVKWEKACKVTDSEVSGAPAVDFAVVLFSKTYRNMTPIVAHGTVLPGFRRPCPRPGISRTRHEDEDHVSPYYRPPPKTCVDEVPKFVVPMSDEKTRLAWKWPSNQDPQFEDSVIGYNARLMEAKITNDWKHLGSEVEYVCFDEGVGNVTVTVYATGRAPMDFAWRKSCTAPTSPFVGKDITTKILIAVISVLVVICMSCQFGCYCCIRRYVGYQRFKNAPDVEVASIVGKGQDDATSD